jgi:hypothetical protein
MQRSGHRRATFAKGGTVHSIWLSFATPGLWPAGLDPVNSLHTSSRWRRSTAFVYERGFQEITDTPLAK